MNLRKFADPRDGGVKRIVNSDEDPEMSGHALGFMLINNPVEAVLPIALGKLLRLSYLDWDETVLVSRAILWGLGTQKVSIIVEKTHCCTHFYCQLRYSHP